MLPKGATVPARQPTREQIVERLSAAQAAWANPPEFEPGNLVQSAPFVAGSGSEVPTSGDAIVMETCPSLREMSGDQNMPNSQGILIAFVTAAGVNYGWYGSWQYVLAIPLPARALDA